MIEVSFTISIYFLKDKYQGLDPILKRIIKILKNLHLDYRIKEMWAQEAEKPLKRIGSPKLINKK